MAVRHPGKQQRLLEAGAWESSFATSTQLSGPEGDQVPEARGGTAN
jgi:hypothetical protein